MIVFGIDQGLAHMGYSIMEFIETKKTNRKNFVKIRDGLWVKIIESGCFVTNSGVDLPKRLFRLTTMLENKILEADPDIVCCERLFFSTPAKGSRNKSSAIMTTNMVTGNIVYICGKHKIKFDFFAPTNVKKLLCGSGKASKDEIIAKIDEIFALDAPSDKIDHIYDSVAIGISCILHMLDNTPSDTEDDGEEE